MNYLHQNVERNTPPGGIWADSGVTILYECELKNNPFVLFSLLSMHFLGFMSNVWYISPVTASVKSFMQPNYSLHNGTGALSCHNLAKMPAIGGRGGYKQNKHVGI